MRGFQQEDFLMPTCFHCLGQHQTSQCIALATDKVTATRKSSTTAIVQAVDRVGGDLSGVIETAGYNTLTGLDWLTGHLQEINSGIQELLDF